MTIKYPVRVVQDNRAVEVEESIYFPGFIVKDANGQWLSALESEQDAHTIANALNALDEFPGIFDETPVEIIEWSMKWLNKE